MKRRHDSRIVLVFAAPGEAGPGDAVLMEGDGVVPDGVLVERFAADLVAGHAPGCACCIERSGAAEALRRLFIALAHGEGAGSGPVFACVASEMGRRAVLQALEEDRFAAARFRLGGAQG